MQAVVAPEPVREVVAPAPAPVGVTALDWFWRAKNAETLDELIDCLERACKLEPDNEMLSANLALAMSRRDLARESEKAARAARRAAEGVSHRPLQRRPSLAARLGQQLFGLVRVAAAIGAFGVAAMLLVNALPAQLRGAAGLPELPLPALGETLMRPTAMLYRNLAAMATEELIRANPVDGAVLLGGCDKTIPALVMGACSVDLPALVVAGGPMLTGTWRGRSLGCGTDVWRLSEEVRAGTLDPQAFLGAESAMVRSRGHCNTMGTASTVACLTEALGLTLPGNAGLPAPDSRLLELAHRAGNRIVAMVAEALTPSRVLSPGSVRNAILTLGAIGGSTNAVLHLLAIAG
ncbi:MAG TPA: dihydroxy-acid dehydratase, partial [Chloroflexota bacterium]|nr:dihydroxy-acid dehydratase [Chloroflexota bacterium]